MLGHNFNPRLLCLGLSGSLCQYHVICIMSIFYLKQLKIHTIAKQYLSAIIVVLS